MLVRGRRRGEGVLVYRVRDFGGTAMKSAKDLDVFKLAHQLVLKTYSATKGFPKEELQPGRSNTTGRRYQRLTLTF
jgi:hypothetical protein